MNVWQWMAQIRDKECPPTSYHPHKRSSYTLVTDHPWLVAQLAKEVAKEVSSVSTTGVWNIPAKHPWARWWNRIVWCAASPQQGMVLEQCLTDGYLLSAWGRPVVCTTRPGTWIRSCMVVQHISLVLSYHSSTRVSRSLSSWEDEWNALWQDEEEQQQQERTNTSSLKEGKEEEEEEEGKEESFWDVCRVLGMRWKQWIPTRVSAADRILARFPFAHKQTHSSYALLPKSDVSSSIQRLWTLPLLWKQLELFVLARDTPLLPVEPHDTLDTWLLRVAAQKEETKTVVVLQHDDRKDFSCSSSSSSSDVTSTSFWMFQMAKRFFSPRMRTCVRSVCDVGCGSGTRTSLLVQELFWFAHVVGVDVRDVLECTRKHSNTWSFQVFDGRSIPLPGSHVKPSHDSYDCIILSHVLHHVEDQHIHALLTSCVDRLSKNGVLILEEHDCESKERDAFLDVVHGVYAQVWSRPPEHPEGQFAASYRAHYRSLDEWNQLLCSMGLVWKQHMIRSQTDPQRRFVAFLQKQ